jgi:single-stranded-DNA-specific exonuclease
MENWRELEKLAPFGLGNPKPVFLFENVKMDKARTFGKNGSGEHLEVVFSDTGGNRTKAVAFFAGGNSFQAPVREGATAKLLGTFDLSRYGGRQELRLRIVDITN